MAHDVFISHSHKDKTIADAICTNLEITGVRCWIAPRDIEPGEDWPTAIAREIPQSRVMVMIFSSSSNTSNQVYRELFLAASNNVIIIPFRIEDIKPEPRVGYLLAGTHWLDAMSPLTQEQINLLVKRVKSILPNAETANLEKTPLPAPEPKVVSLKPELQVRKIKARRGVLKSETFSRRTAIMIGLVVLGLGLFAVFFKSLSALPASLLPTPTPTATQTVFVVPATKTPVPATSTATVVPTPILDIGSTEISPKDGMILLYVPQGKFLMGSTDADVLTYILTYRTSSNETPQHSVTLKAFWIDETEVTNAMYAKCVKAGKCEIPSNFDHFDNSNFANHPVVYVDWNRANAYCSWAERRLPTEAEWEKAASWNGRTQEKYVYPWGNDFNSSIVNFCDKNCTADWADKTSDDGFADTSPVKNYPGGVSPYGAYDMAGNAFEWVNDWFQDDYYATLGDSASNPLGPARGEGRVLRGGSWKYNNYSVRSAFRNWDYPVISVNNFGFRCARSLP